MVNHISTRHERELPENMSPSKFIFSVLHGGRTTGVCRVCANETQFDEKIGKPAVLCDNPKCKQAFAKLAQERNIRKYGVPHLLNDQDHQMYMLSRRKISGEYLWSDGKTKIPYVGSYERRFLEFMDNIVDINPKYIHSPCPFTIYYEFEGETHAYTPDFYIDILDLIIEIKHGGDNPNNHPKIQSVDIKKDKAKEEAIKNTTNHNYIKIVDNKFGPLLKILFKLIENEKFNSDQRLFMLNESSNITNERTEYILEKYTEEDIANILNESEMIETQSLASLAPIATSFVGREIDDIKSPVSHVTSHKEIYKDTPLYITIYKDQITESYKIGVSTNLNEDPIVYHLNKFVYYSHCDFPEDKMIFSIYKYVGNENPLNDYKNLLEKLNQPIVRPVPYGSDVQAFTSIFKRIFSRPVYHIGEIITHPDFVRVYKSKVLK